MQLFSFYIQGVIFGLLCGIAMNAWIGTGALIYEYPQTKLPRSVESCPENASSFFSLANSTSFQIENVTVSTSTVSANISTDYIPGTRYVIPFFL